MHLPDTIAVKLSKAANRMVKKGHPWIFDRGIIKQSKEGKAGDLAIIFDNETNKFIGIGLYDPYSPIRIKLLSAHQKILFNFDWIQSKFKEAYEIRSPLFQNHTNSYRLIFGENDGLPGMIIDVYADVCVLKLYSMIWYPYLDEVKKAIVHITDCKCIVLRAGRNIQGKMTMASDGDILYGSLENEVVHFEEYGVHFSANVIHGHKTGYFLDHRQNRHRVGQLSRGKNVLDVFSYAGGFSVHALVGGAQEVTSVDISTPALKLAAYNAGLNNFMGKHHTIAGDAFEVMNKLIEANRKFDIVVVDPPSFAKKKEEVDGALKSYARLVKLAIQLVKRHGVLVMASCSSRVSADQFFSLVESEISKRVESFEILEKTFHDIDHPISFAEGAYLKCGYYKLH